MGLLPPDALPLHLAHGAVVSQASGIILDELPTTSFSTEDASTDDHGALVLGFQGAAAGMTSILDLNLGQLKAGRMLACARCKLWWMTPEWRSSTLQLPPETQFLLVELKGPGAAGVGQGAGDAYALLLPLIDGDFRTTLRPGSGKDAKEGSLVLRVESGDKRVQRDVWHRALYVAAGTDPFQLIERGVAAAARLSGSSLPRAQKQLPPSLDVFGWCTWDAFYSTVSARGVLDGLSSLKKGGIHVRSIIIDDGWQSTDVDPEFRKPRQPEAAAAAAAAETEARAPVWSHAAQRVQGWLLSLGTALFLLFYQGVVEPAPPGTWPVRLFTWLATGVLRPPLLAFFANASDFTRRLTSVLANPKFSHPDAGPTADTPATADGLKSVVSVIKKTFGVDFVYCWHGLPMYWSGVMPDAPEMQPYCPSLMYAQATPGVLEVEPSMAWNPAVLAGVGVIHDPGLLYNNMHQYLSASGVDGVKVDCQAGLGLLGACLGGGPALSRKFHAALEDSVARHFPGNHCINCMCHSTENLYRMSHTSVARVSDDFFPRDAASSHPHLAACAFNGLFMSALVQPDWDMFQSKHSSAQLHAMARSISGGAVYVSDKPGEHDFELLRRLVLPDGSVLRTLLPARPTRDCLFQDVLRDDRSLLKVWSMNSYCGVVGVFHLQGSSWDRTRRKFLTHDKAPRPLTVQARPRDVEGMAAGGAGAPPDAAARYAVYSFVGKALVVLGRDEALQLHLKTATSELLTVSPVTEVGGLSFAPLGLLQMYNGGAAVLSCTAQPAAPASTSGPEVAVSVRGCGSFLAFCSRAPTEVRVERLPLFFTYDAGSGTLQLDVPATKGLACTVSISF